VRILVAVADVDALVRTGSAIEKHARSNATSVYTCGYSRVARALTDSLDVAQPNYRLARCLKINN